MLRIKKFSWNANDKEAKITYSIERDGSSEKHQMECPDKPMPELLAALQGLEYDALIHPPVELPTAYAWANGRQEIPQDRLEQLAKLQKGRRP